MDILAHGWCSCVYIVSYWITCSTLLDVQFVMCYCEYGYHLVCCWHLVQIVKRCTFYFAAINLIDCSCMLHFRTRVLLWSIAIPSPSRVQQPFAGGGAHLAKEKEELRDRISVGEKCRSVQLLNPMGLYADCCKIKDQCIWHVHGTDQTSLLFFWTKGIACYCLFGCC